MSRALVLIMLVGFPLGAWVLSRVPDPGAELADEHLVVISPHSPEIREEAKGCSWNLKGAEQVGALIAKQALAEGIEKVCFDRNGYKYHGRVKALAESARKHGLQF